MSRRLSGLAALWGFAEATLFVVVPDVLLSWIALRRGLRPALAACLAAALGATLGGAATVLAARLAPDAATNAVAALPAIDAALIADTHRRFAEGGIAAALAGAFSGVPYKLYALSAGAAGEGAAALLAATPLIRLPRFLGASILAALAGRLLVPRVGRRAATGLLAAVWIAFYGWYWTVMPG